MMKHNFSRYIVSVFVIIFIVWTISCSGRPEKQSESEVNASPGSSSEVAVKLIKMISPEENTAFKLRDPVKVVLAAGNRNNLPDSVLINFNGQSCNYNKVRTMGVFNSILLYCDNREKITESICI